MTPGSALTIVLKIWTLLWQASMAKYEMDDSLGLFGGWREALNEQLADIAEDHEAEQVRLSSTSPPFPSPNENSHQES